jgi:preprotein translocase subunit YajC
MAAYLLMAQQGVPFFQDPMFMGLILCVMLFYFMILRPSRRQQQELRSMLASLKKNDEVLAAGGIIGTVVNIKEKAIGNEDEVTLKVDDRVRLRVLRSSIVRILSKAGEPSEQLKETSGT